MHQHTPPLFLSLLVTQATESCFAVGSVNLSLPWDCSPHPESWWWVPGAQILACLCLLSEFLPVWGHQRLPFPRLHAQGGIAALWCIICFPADGSFSKECHQRTHMRDQWPLGLVVVFSTSSSFVAFFSHARTFLVLSPCGTVELGGWRERPELLGREHKFTLGALHAWRRLDACHFH